MNYPEKALLTALVSDIGTRITGRTVSTIPPKDTDYPYVWISQTDMQEIGSKKGFIYRFEPLIQVIHKDITSLENLLSDMNAIHQLIKNGADLTVSGYTVIAVELISTNRMTELYEWGRLEIGLIRPRIDLY